MHPNILSKLMAQHTISHNPGVVNTSDEGIEVGLIFWCLRSAISDQPHPWITCWLNHKWQ